MIGVGGWVCGMVAVGLAVAALLLVVRGGGHRRAAVGSRWRRAGRAATAYLLTANAQRGRSAPSRSSGAAPTQRPAGGRDSGRDAGGSGLHSVGGLRVGQRVTPTGAIHTSRGTAWPGTIGVIVHIGGGGQLADTFTVRFPGFVARGVYRHQIRAA